MKMDASKNGISIDDDYEYAKNNLNDEKVINNLYNKELHEKKSL